jgi:hypothetical protein
MKKKFIVLSTITAFSIHKVSLSLVVMAALISPAWGNNTTTTKNQTRATAEIVNTPLVDNDQVTVRIKVKNSEDKPMIGLQDINFQLMVDKQEVIFSSRDWKSPKETIPPPAWIIVLLDLSGSMNGEDSGGTKKIQGAINAIRQFIQVLNQRGGETQISIVPFGEPGRACQGHPVNDQTLDQFFLAKDVKLKNYLDYLESIKPCASTNLYQPLSLAVRFLANGEDERFGVSEKSSQPPPRLSIILLSDGYHNTLNEENDFQDLMKLLERNKVTIHTLGYGLTPQELGKKYGLNRSATRADIGTGQGKVPEAEFVDQNRLQQIAKATNGITEFSGNAQAIATNLQTFLNALLGEYEITYSQPNPERGKKHQVEVVVNFPSGETITSPPKPYRIKVFGRSLPGQVRLIILIITLIILTLGGLIPFYLWGKQIKQETLQ